MISLSSLFRVDCVLKFSVVTRPVNYFQGCCAYHGLSYNFKMGGGKEKQSALDQNKKLKKATLVWRPVCTQAVSDEACKFAECLVKDVIVESEDGSQVQELQCSTSSIVSNVQHVMKSAEPVTEKTDSNIRFSTVQCIDEDNNILEGESEKHSISAEAVKSPNLDYSHFISLPLAIHPELVNKLLNFQNSILGNSDGCPDENWDSDSNEDATDNEVGHRQLDKQPDVAVELKTDDDDNEHVKVNRSKIPLVNYAPKASKSSPLSENRFFYFLSSSSSSNKHCCMLHSADLGIDKSIFNKPKTFHLTVLMLKLWNKDRVSAAAEVLQSISSKVMDALDNRPVSIRLKGLDCMKGSLAKARVLYAPVEEIGSEDRLLRACQVITDAYVEAGLVLEKDANQKLKLHATVMNVRHRKREKWTRNADSFDARGIFKQFGSEEWGEYLIREAHLSQIHTFDENGYYHCCASIPFPENMQVD
ncbi:uncharacterized protein LOC142636271 isoform X6 [Castanea sativa]|uniref:uncharacterized protein LOC142636271 isoform X6 n=1 Tax=Castanea sativa TaxID=21020 RepID=UPI003F64E822